MILVRTNRGTCFFQAKLFSVCRNGAHCSCMSLDIRFHIIYLVQPQAFDLLRFLSIPQVHILKNEVADDRRNSILLFVQKLSCKYTLFVQQIQFCTVLRFLLKLQSYQSIFSRLHISHSLKTIFLCDKYITNVEFQGLRYFSFLIVNVILGMFFSDVHIPCFL